MTSERESAEARAGDGATCRVAVPSVTAPHRLSANENPYTPLPGVLAAVVAAAGACNRYPDPGCAAMVAALAARLEVAPAHIAAGPGSIDLLHRLTELVCGPGDEAVLAWRSYEGHRSAVSAAGAVPILVPLTPAGAPDLPRMIAAITPRTRMMFVCSPNNPTGVVSGHAELDHLLDSVPPDVLIVLDEAYRDFTRDPAAADGVTLYRRHPRLCVVRTFSKGYGLAGLRVGYLVAHDEVAARVRRSVAPYAVSQLAQDAVVASLEQDRALAARVDTLVAERTRIRAELLAQGWTVPASQANFLWLGLGNRTAEFVASCAAAGLAVKAFPGEGARVSVAVATANDVFLHVAARMRPTPSEDPRADVSPGR